MTNQLSPRLLAAVLAVGALSAPAALAQVSIPAVDTPVTQNFDTLATSGATNPWADNTTLSGWYSQFVATPTNPTVYRAEAGTGNAGAIYSYGTGTATERAFGSVSSGTPGNILNAVRLVNNTGVTITALHVAFTGEQWRNGGNTAAQRLDFQYQVAAPGTITDANTPATGWTDFNGLDFVSPTVGATAAALDGNLAANRTALAAVVGVTVNAGDEIWLRWLDTNDAGNDHGLAIDNFAIVANPTGLTINDVALAEGNAGTTTFSFTVSLFAPAPAGGVTFDIATADNTATTADGDYVLKSLTGQTIPAGQSVYTFDVTVNGDVAIEPNESFFVNVTNVVGVSVLDGQGLGTITNDDFPPTLSINDVSLSEGNAGTSTFTFTVSLSAPAPAGGVTFDIATADGTATTADNDYVTNSITGHTIAAGGSSATFDVTVNGDAIVESNETFFVNVTNVTGTGVVVGDGQGQGTIVNDDFVITPIHDIQGPGASSPIPGSVVTARGVVTGVRSNGFFIQAPDAEADADPLTSEGILVFTSSAPPAAAVVGNLVNVTGTVVEFIPSADPLQPPLTELGGSPTVVVLSSGNPLPAVVPLTTTFPDPAGVHDQLERLEGMRVSVSSLTVTGPTLGSVNEPNATATSSGVFYGVVTGVARPFREAGVQQPDALPAGSPCCVPRFDTNPERIRVDSDGLVGGPLIDVGTGAVVTGLVGPLDYTFRTYTILPDVPSSPGVTGGPTPTAVTPPSNLEFTVGSYNLERFFDTADDPATSDPVLTATAFDNRLNKASRAIRNFLRFPDVLGVAEVENLTTLQALATRINNDAVANSQPNPLYAAYLVEGNDIGGIDVGFLVKTAEVSAGVPRVEVVEVVQEGEEVTWVDPSDNVVRPLHDRPTLRLAAVIHHPNGSRYPVLADGPLQVLVNHLRSLTGVGDPRPDGLTTTGERVRLKRKLQAEWLANYIQARQTATPAERLIAVGDFNAFEVNDGFVDSMGTISGAPAADDQTVVPGDGTDLVTPNLGLLLDAAPQRYSFVFDGNAQSLDHVLVNAALVGDGDVSERVEHARIGADYPETARNDTTNAVRLSDHDPLVAYFTVGAFPVELESFSIE